MTKNVLFALLFLTRLTRLVAWFNRKKVTILCYHSVTEQRNAKLDDPHQLHLPLELFCKHLDYLQRHYRLISLREYARARRENIKLPNNVAILTFDDGARNFFTVVAPLLLKTKIPATSFIVTGDDFTGEVGAGGSNWRPEDDDSYLSWNEVRQLTEQGLEFGSHTCTHATLPDIPVAQARAELETSRNTLRNYLGSDSYALSYPHGRTSEVVNRLSQALGYSCAVTTALGANDSDADLFALRRTVIAAQDDLPTFAARLSGLTTLYSRLAGYFRRNAPQDSEPSLHRHESQVVEERSGAPIFNALSCSDTE